MTNFKEKDMSCRNCKYWNECQTEFIVYASTAPIDRKTMHCINWTPESNQIMICDKSSMCAIDCEDKIAHKETSYCKQICKWGGICIPFEAPISQNNSESPYWLKSGRHG